MSRKGDRGKFKEKRIVGANNGEDDQVLGAEIRARTEALANRIGLDFAPDRPFLMMALIFENLMDRIELLEDVYKAVQEEARRNDPAGGG